MIQITSKIQDSKYYLLIDYLLDKCDTFTFNLPNYNKEIVTHKNADFFPEFEVGHVEIDNSNDDFNQYKSEVNHRIRFIRRNLLETYKDIEYCGSIYGNELEIYVCTLDENASGFLKATDGLYSWYYPHMPEDLCFYSKGKCFLKSIAHENLCFIYANDKDTKKALKRMKLKFIEFPWEEAPKLKG